MTIRHKLPLLKQLFTLVATYTNKPHGKEKYISFTDLKLLL